MRKILGALVVAVFLCGPPVPVSAASPAPASCKRHKAKKAKFSKPGKYKVSKFKVKKAGKRQHYRVKPSNGAATKRT